MLPIEERDWGDAKKHNLMGIHDAVMDNVRKELKRLLEFFGYDEDEKNSNDSLFLELNERIVIRDKSENQKKDAIIGGELHFYLRENRERSRVYCEKVFQTLFDELKIRLNPIPDGYTEKMLQEEVDELKNSYKKQAIGPAKIDVLNERLQSSDMTGFFQMCKAIQGFQMQINETNRKHEALSLQNEIQKRKLQEVEEESAREREEHSKALQDMAENNRIGIEKMLNIQEENRLKHERKVKELYEANHQRIAEMTKSAQKKDEQRMEMHQQEMAKRQKHFEDTLAKAKMELQTSQSENRRLEGEVCSERQYSQRLRDRGFFWRLFNWDPAE
ncbi:uncharacterized protein LOC106161843 [Lingula anatina]|uniref:Uncharacterized protein LOC106161843 n=1 Tax=Lingula anatina TaxID=7574 RepID=A0A1S3IAC5_LINAN|nr:uncharacterized protein LOC106161843 [Lingula anatina]|eukprot:XP_013394359.1 uncharacterized protein LOC106161843 [Lingula anatina]